MMEPHATIAAWDGDKVTLWDLEPDDRPGAMAASPRSSASRRRTSGSIPPYVGGGFGGMLVRARRRCDGRARGQGRQAPREGGADPPLVMNNTTHRPATIHRVRIGATKDGTITAIAHESTSGNLPDGDPETAVSQTKLL